MSSGAATYKYLPPKVRATVDAIAAQIKVPGHVVTAAVLAHEALHDLTAEEHTQAIAVLIGLRRRRS